MRLVLKLIMMLFIIGTPFSAFADKQAKTINELAKKYDSSSCKTCHEQIYNDWEKSIHSRSIFGTGRTTATIKTAIEIGLKDWKYSGVKTKEDVKIKHLMICAKCHLPQLSEASDEVAQEIVKAVYSFMDGSDQEREKAEKTLKKLNINCLICHNRNAIVHKWVDGFPAPGEIYGSKDMDHADPAHPKMKKSPIMGESILCGQCHGLGPNLELENPSQCGTLYGSYLWSYQAEGGTEKCQDCHMHKSGLGHNMQSYRSEAMGKAAVEFQVEAYGHHWRDGSRIIPQAFVTVEMTNKTGHTIPDG